MNHTQIKAFHAVATLGSFSKAAESLFLTQPAVSEQVRRLEQDNDMLLFKRERKGVRLTANGEELFHFTKRYFEIEDQIDDCLTDWNARLKGHLRLLADSAMHVTDIVSRFRAKYPEVKMTIHVGNSENILTELRNYNADIGVVGGYPEANDIEALQIGSSPIIAFAHRGILQDRESEMSLAEIADYPLVLREAGSKTRQQVLNRAKDLGVTLDLAFEVEGREAVRATVLSKGGVGFVSQAEFIPDPRLVEIHISDLNTRMVESIVNLSQRNDVRLIRRFMELAREELGREDVARDNLAEA